MAIAHFLAHYRLATSAEVRVRAVQEMEPAATSGEILTSFLSSDALLWGCLALALIALFTVSRVFSRRREERKVNRAARAQSQALHDFLVAVRAEHANAAQGVWHYDFTSGAQQYSDAFKRLVGGAVGELPQAPEVKTMLDRSGIDLVTLARDHFEQAEPYEVRFALQDREEGARPMVLKACNLRDGEGRVQHMVAVISEATDTGQNTLEN